MKTLNTLLTLSLLVLGTAGFASSDGRKSGKNSNVPVAPSVWEAPEIEVPQSLKFVKAKNAFVPVADFVWGDPSEAPVHLLIVPVAPFVFGDHTDAAPEELVFVKTKLTNVPVAPTVWGNASEEPGEITLK